MPAPAAKIIQDFQRLFLTHGFHLSLIAFLSAVILFANLDKGGLSGLDDAFYAHEGKQMLTSGDWWNIRVNGYLNFEYPPMFIWLEALSMKIFGISDFSAKFPSAVAGLLTILLVYFIARELSEDFWLPVFSAWILMLSQYFMKYAMHAMTDVPFTFFFTLSLWLYLKGLRNRQYFILCGLAVAISILTRSVLGVLPLGIIFTHLILIGRQRLLWSGYFASGVLVAILLPAIWYFSQYQLHGSTFITTHFSFISGKVAGVSASVFSNVFEYPWLLLRLYWPWLPLLVVGLIIQVKAAVFHKQKSAIFLIVWVVMIIVPFSLVEAKVLRYILPVFPAFAVISAIPLIKWLSESRRARYLPVAFSILTLAVLLIAAFPKPKYRAEMMSQLAPVTDLHTDLSRRVVIYTYGEMRHDLVAQFLWYSNRFCEPVVDTEKMRERFLAGNGVFIIDKNTYANLTQTTGVNSEILADVEDFVCVKILPASKQEDVSAGG